MLRGFTYDGRRALRVEALDAPDTSDRILALGAPAVGDAELPLDLADDFVGPSARAWNSFVQEHGGLPDIVTVEGAGAFRVKHSGRTSGDQHQSGEQPVAAERGSTMHGRIAVVTGGAQGFGLALAEELAGGGATVALVDLNLDGAEASAADLNARFGEGSAVACAANVADDDSVAAMTDKLAARFGGFDLFISNAGVLRAGSVLSLSVKDFSLVTDVNYSAFFVCTKHASSVMRLQDAGYRARVAAAAAAGDAKHTASLPAHYTTDILQINSKSGLKGSNKNGAYAGSKFGGIGLVQSFALELVEYGIKVNAICPGNFFDGPLWSDPDRGLFVQYLNAGKVPGAQSIDDVKRHYEKQVPLGRGCTGADVARAVYYVVDQVYETGQAIPVTGGQEMLR
ncbi:MAG: SDR family NAD(P)-dependent oxidoreductase [Spirochaetaceae bacterium]|nr:MAG: SDR family NAD(P)-dependent oxidoreductase [Spirochaetaceae bacterium]